MTGQPERIQLRRADHILHARVGRQAQWVELECIGGVGTGRHITVDAEGWDFDDDEQMAALDAAGKVDRSRCWTEEWLNEGGVDCLDGTDEWPGDGPWPVRCWFDGDCMRIEHIDDLDEDSE